VNILAPASEAARAVSEIAWWMIGGGALIFVGVMLLALLGWRSGPRRLRPVVWIAGGGIAFPTLVLSALLAWSESRIDGLIWPGAGESPVIGLTGHMWWWEVRYSDPDSGRIVTGANELRIPVGRAVVVGVTSADVVHSFWVPELGGKIDMVPGRSARMWLQADRPGVYRGQCAEYCGAQHARMALHVVAMPVSDYEAWLRTQARPVEVSGGLGTNEASGTTGTTDAADTADATDTADTDAADVRQLRRGRQAFAELRCGLCHRVREADPVAPGPEPVGTLGPDLTHVGSRLHIAAGTLPAGRESLRAWIEDPQRFKPGVRMPSYAHVEPETLDALAAWLERLK